MNEEPLSRTPNPAVVTRLDDVETALADLRWALEEEDEVEKHYHVRSAMQRLQLLLDRADGSSTP